MNNSKRKFPFWAVIVIAGIIIGAFIIGNILAIKHIVADVGKPVELGPSYTVPARTPLTRDHIIAISTVVIPSALIIVNIILVVVTFYYARQSSLMASATAKMSEATKATVDYYNQTRKDDLMPLFVPMGTAINKRNPKDNHFIFRNLGNTALFVKVETEVIDDATFQQSQAKIESGELMFFAGPIKQRSFLKKQPEMLYIYISFKNKVSNQYKQVIRYNCKHNRLYFDKESLPVEQIAD